MYFSCIITSLLKSCWLKYEAKDLLKRIATNPLSTYLIIALCLGSTQLQGQVQSGQPNPVFGIGVGSHLDQPGMFGVVARYRLSAYDNVEKFIQVGVSVVNFKPSVEKIIGVKFGRNNGWSSDFYLLAGYGQRKLLQLGDSKIRLFATVTASATYEQYSVTNGWVQRRSQFVAYSNATYAVYHCSVAASVGIRFPINRITNISISPISFRTGLKLVTVPNVKSPQALNEAPSEGLTFLQKISPVDHKMGLQSTFSIFDGPILLIEVTF